MKEWRQWCQSSYKDFLYIEMITVTSLILTLVISYRKILKTQLISDQEKWYNKWPLRILLAMSWMDHLSGTVTLTLEEFYKAIYYHNTTIEFETNSINSYYHYWSGCKCFNWSCIIFSSLSHAQGTVMQNKICIK